MENPCCSCKPACVLAKVVEKWSGGRWDGTPNSYAPWTKWRGTFAYKSAAGITFIHR